LRRARFLDKPKVIRALSRLAARLKKNDDDVLKIVLFGSLATDTYTGISDADILIVLKKSNVRFIDRIPKFSLQFADAPLPVDVFPYTESEAVRVPLAQRALSEGLLLS